MSSSLMFPALYMISNLSNNIISSLSKSLLSNTWFQQGGLITGQSRLRFQSNFEQGTYMHVYRTCSYLILQCRTILNLIFFLSQWQTFCHKHNIVFIFGQNNDLNCCSSLSVRFQPRFQTSFQGTTYRFSPQFSLRICSSGIYRRYIWFFMFIAQYFMLLF